ncbi:MAG TPA: cytochrome P450, partial [Acidimicrobiales bacterium]|nr:cytochrome P450 [Acidimicrobiales bacterium]
SRFADVESCSVDWQTYSSARGTVLEIIQAGIEVPKGLFIFEDPPLHNLHRRLMARVFTARRVALLESRMRAYCAAALDPFVGEDGFDFVRDLGADLPMQVISDLVGIPADDRVAVRDHFDEGLRIEEGRPPPRGGMAAARATDMSHFPEYLAYRREHPADDLMTDLIETRFVDDEGVERHLSDEEVLNYTSLLAAAGNETTTKLIGWTGYLLGAHPDQRRQLAEEPSLVPGAIEEILRYEAPSPVQARYVTREVEMHDATMPEGSVLLLLTAAANRDERQFVEPDRFDVRRTIDHHVSFGFGLHFCMGAALARLEGRVALEEVLARFPDWEVELDRAERVHTTTVRGWHRLPVLFS